MIWVIRYYRPEIIITRFSATPDPENPTHGHHTASTVLAQKAFKMAADPSVFPNQLKQLNVWQAKQLLWNRSDWFDWKKGALEDMLKEQNKPYLKVTISDYVPLLGLTCADISANSYSIHKSQGLGSSPIFGEQFDYLEYVAGQSIGKELFEGIPSVFERYLFGKKLQQLIKKAAVSFNPNKPWESIPTLNKIAKQFEIYGKKEPRFNPKIPARLAFRCSGIQLKASSTSAVVARGDTATLKLEVFNPSPIPVKSVSVTLPDGKEKMIGDIKPLKFSTTELKWATSANTPLSQPYWLEKEAIGSLFTLPKGIFPGEIVFSETGSNLQCRWQMDHYSMTQLVTSYFRYTDPVKGAIAKMLSVVPRASITFDHSVYLFSTKKTTTVNLTLEPFTSIEKGHVILNLPSGFKSEPAFYEVAKLEKSKKYDFSFVVTATADVKNA